MALPIVEGSVVNTPNNSIQISAGPFQEAAMAQRKLALKRGELAQTIGDVGGDFFTGIAKQIQDVRNARKVFDADQAMHATQDKFLQDTQKDPSLARDPSTWADAYNQRVQETSESIMTQPGVGPQLKRHLQMMTQDWAYRSSTEVKNNALKLEVEDAKTSGLITATRSIQELQGQKAEAAYRALNEIGAIGPAATKAYISQIPGKIAEAKANNAMTADPISAPAAIEKLKGDLPPQKFRTLLNVAKEGQIKEQSANAQDLSERIDLSPTHTIDKKLPDQWLKDGKIRDSDYKKVMDRMQAYATADTRERNKQEKDDFNVAMMEADNPPTDGTSLEAWAADRRNAGLSFTNPALRRRLNDFVDKKVESINKKGESNDPPVLRDALDQLKRESSAQIGSREILDRREGKYVMSDKAVQDSYGDPSDRIKLAEGQKVEAARQTQQLRDWFHDYTEGHAGKLPTPEEVSTERQRILSPQIEGNVKKSLGAPAMSQSDLDAATWATAHPDDPRAKKIIERLRNGE